MNKMIAAIAAAALTACASAPDADYKVALDASIEHTAKVLQCRDGVQAACDAGQAK